MHSINNSYGWHNAPVFDDEFSSDSTSPSGSQGEEESPINSAQTTPKKREAVRTPEAATEATPKKVKTLEALIPDLDPACDLTRKEREILDEGLEELAKTRDTPEHKKRSNLALRMTSAGMKVLFTEGEIQDPNSPHFHRKAAEGLNNSPWIGEILQTTSRLHHTAQHPVDEKIQRIINLDHLTEFDKRGFHFCPVDHKDRPNIKSIILNPVTGVWCGCLQDKFSTFYPDWVHSKEELVRVINESEFICCKDNRELRRVQHPSQEHSFYLEAYVRDGIKYQSIFPLFCHEQWQDGRVYKIAETLRPITSIEALEAAQKLGRSGIRFRNDQFVTIDIAPALDTKDLIKQGIYFTFPLNVF